MRAVKQPHELLEEFSDGAIMNEVGELIQRSRIAIDDSQQRAAAFGDNRKRSSGLHLQGGTDDDEEIRLFAPGLSALHGFDRHGLAEGHVGRFQKAAAYAANWSRQTVMPDVVDIGGLVAFATIEASDEAIGAVKLDELGIRTAGELVQAVDVLRDETEQLAALFELADREVSEIGFDRF